MGSRQQAALMNCGSVNEVGLDAKKGEERCVAYCVFLGLADLFVSARGTGH